MSCSDEQMTRPGGKAVCVTKARFFCVARSPKTIRAGSVATRDSGFESPANWKPKYPADSRLEIAGRQRAKAGKHAKPKGHKPIPIIMKSNPSKFYPVVQELVSLIKEHKWEKDFQTAIKRAHDQNVPPLKGVTNLAQYLDWINRFLHWIPSENSAGQGVYDHLGAFYFIVDQEPLLSLQKLHAGQTVAGPPSQPPEALH
jgi:hypothetical protein